ncbi:MAG: CvpA family protein [Kiritimatiellaeota bacterium]|nr:CvpA family protein [Kiritimatiellota bacterium]
MQNLLNTVKGIGWIDGLVLLAVLFLVVRGFVRGASGELSGLLSTCAMALFCLFGFSPLMGKLKAIRFMADYPQASRFIALILIAVAAIALWLLSRKLLAHSISLILPKLFDRILGGVFGGISAVIIVILCCAGGIFGSPENAQRQTAGRSVVIEKLAPLIEKITNAR